MGLRMIPVAALIFSGCLSSPPQSNAEGDAGPDDQVDGGTDSDSGIPAAPCAQPSLVTDNFAGTLSQWQVVKVADDAVNIADGQVSLKPAVDEEASITTVRAFDLSTGATSIEVTGWPSAESGTEVQFSVDTADGSYVRFRAVNGGELVLEHLVIPGMTTQLDSYVLSADNHRFLQIRGDRDGTVFWEASGDGKVFEVLGSAQLERTLSLSRVSFRALANDDPVEAGTVTLDNFNGGGAPSGNWCPASSFQEDFSAGSPPFTWRAFHDSACSVNGGKDVLQFDLDVGWADDCGLVSRPLFELQDSWVSVEVVKELPGGVSGMMVLRLQQATDGESNQYDLRKNGGTLQASRRVGANTGVLDERLFNASNHAFWRIREQGGTVYFETSPDASTWEELAITTDLIDLSQVESRIMVLNPQEIPFEDAESVVFDNYNLIP